MSQATRRWSVWGVPLILGALSGIGLLSALLGEHFAWKALCWLTLSVPVVVGAWFARPREGKTRK
jgi:hypothetical protein